LTDKWETKTLYSYLKLTKHW